MKHTIPIFLLLLAVPMQTMYQSVFAEERALLLTSSQGEVFYCDFGH